MVSLQQLVRKKGARKQSKKKLSIPVFEGSPQRKGVCVKIIKMSPKKPNSAKRSVAKVRLLNNGRVVYCYLPGQGHSLQEYSIVLLRGARIKDLPGVKIKAIRGCFDFKVENKRVRSRSKFGMKHPKNM